MNTTMNSNLPYTESAIHAQLRHEQSKAYIMNLNKLSDEAQMYADMEADMEAETTKVNQPVLIYALDANSIPDCDFVF